MELTQDERFIRRAIALSREAVRHGSEPFGALLVRRGKNVDEQAAAALPPTPNWD